MTDVSPRYCRSCGGPIEASTGSRGGRPREHCHICRPSQAAARRSRRDHELLTQPCRRCGQPIDHPVSIVGRRRQHCHACVPARTAPADVELDDLLADPAIAPVHRSVLARVAELAETGDWRPCPIGRLLISLHQLLVGREDDGQRVRRSELRSAVRAGLAVKLSAAVLEEHELLDDDTVPSTRAWIERKSAQLPGGFREETRTWLLELHDGSARTRPRSRSTLYAYFGRVRPHLIA